MTYTLAVTRAAFQSSDATLRTLGMDPASIILVPVFTGSTTSYTANVGNAIATMRVTPMVSQANATVTVNGAAVTSDQQSQPITLTEDMVTTITVVVTAQNGTTMTYTLAVTRAAFQSSDATLRTLGIDPATVTLVPAFTGSTTSYTSSVGNAVPTIRVTPDVSQANATVTVNGAAVTSGQPSQTITLTADTVTTITVVVTAQNGTTTKTYTVAVTRAAAPAPVNQAPTANAGSDFTGYAGHWITLPGSATDPDTGDTLSYSWSRTSGPAVTLLRDDTLSPIFRVPVDPATWTFQLTVTDSHGAMDTDDVTVNSTRQIRSLGLRATPSTISYGSSWNTTVSASSVHRASSYASFCSFSLSERSRVQIDLSSPVDTYLYLLYGSGDSGAVLTSDDDGGSSNNSRITRDLSAGAYTMEATTKAGGTTGSFALILEVSEATTSPPPNQAPTADAGANQTVHAGATVTLSGSGSDPDTGDTLTYSWTQIGTPAVTISNANSDTATFTAPSSAASLTFSLTVTDNHGASSGADYVTVTVQNRAPTANAGANQTVNTGDTVTLSGSGSDPDTGATLTYSWTQIGTPAVTISNANRSTATFTAPSSAASLWFRLTVTDSQQASDTDDVTITVQASAPATPSFSSIQFNFASFGSLYQSGNHYAADASANTNGYSFIIKDDGQGNQSSLDFLAPVCELHVRSNTASQVVPGPADGSGDPYIICSFGLSQADFDALPDFTQPGRVRIGRTSGGVDTTWTLNNPTITFDASEGRHNVSFNIILDYPITGDNAQAILTMFNSAGSTSSNWIISADWGNF